MASDGEGTMLKKLWYTAWALYVGQRAMNTVLYEFYRFVAIVKDDNWFSFKAFIIRPLHWLFCRQRPNEFIESLSDEDIAEFNDRRRYIT